MSVEVLVVAGCCFSRCDRGFVIMLVYLWVADEAVLLAWHGLGHNICSRW